MANPLQILYSGTTTNVPVLGIGPSDNNIGINGPDQILFYFDGTATQSLDLTAAATSTALLSATPGTLTASKAVIVDASSKIDAWNVGNLSMSVNTLSSTDINGNVILSPNGTGNVDVASSNIINLTDPVLAQDAATKSYVDSVATGLLDFKNSVRVITGANIDLAVAADPGAQDGVTLADGDRIALGAQTAGSENGIYDAVTVIDPTTWVRSSDANTSAEVTAGMFFFVEEGTTNGNSGFVLSTNNPIVLDTTVLTFVKFSTQGAISGTASRVTIVGGVVDIAATYVGQASITTLGTITTGTWNGIAIDQTHGGTGADLSAIAASALLRQNAGQTAFEAAVVDTDYLAPGSLIGGQTF